MASIPPENRLLTTYVSYCMEQMALAQVNEEWKRFHALQYLAHLLLNAYAGLEMLHDNLLNHWPQTISAPEGIVQVCAEIRARVEEDLCYPVFLAFKERRQKILRTIGPGPVYYAIRDVVCLIGQHGYVDASWNLQLYADEQSLAIEQGDLSFWRSEKLTVYQEALEQLERHGRYARFKQPFFTIEMRPTHPTNNSRFEAHVVTRGPANVIYPTGKTPRSYPSIRDAREAAQWCNRHRGLIEFHQREIDNLCFAPNDEQDTENSDIPVDSIEIA